MPPSNSSSSSSSQDWNQLLRHSSAIGIVKPDLVSKVYNTTGSSSTGYVRLLSYPPLPVFNMSNPFFFVGAPSQDNPRLVRTASRSADPRDFDVLARFWRVLLGPALNPSSGPRVGSFSLPTSRISGTTVGSRSVREGFVCFYHDGYFSKEGILWDIVYLDNVWQGGGVNVRVGA